MNVVIDQDKWLKAIAEEEPLPCGLLAVSPYLWFSVRRHPEVNEDKLSAMVAVLISYIQDLDRNLGGTGVHFDPTGTVLNEEKLTILLVVNATGDFLGRIYAITDKLSELAKQAKHDLVARQDADINAKIAADLGSPVPPPVREAAEHLEPLRG
jgi:hypothetical protein